MEEARDQAGAPSNAPHHILPTLQVLLLLLARVVRRFASDSIFYPNIPESSTVLKSTSVDRKHHHSHTLLDTLIRYSLRPKILVEEMNVSRCIFVLGTSIFMLFSGE